MIISTVHFLQSISGSVCKLLKRHLDIQVPWFCSNKKVFWLGLYLYWSKFMYFLFGEVKQGDIRPPMERKPEVRELPAH